MLSKYWLIFLAVTSVSSVSTEADACSIAYDVDYTVSQVATPDRIVFESTDPSSSALVTVTNLSGDTMPGTVEPLDGAPYGHVWIPDEPLTPGPHEVRIENEQMPSETVQTVDVRPAQDIEVSFDMTPSEVESITDMVCCDTEVGGCFDSCASCVSCWPAGYEYVPQVELDIRASEPVLVDFVLRDTNSGAEAHGNPLLTVLPATTVFRRLQQEALGEVCVDLTATDLDGAELYRESRCFEMSDLERFDRRAPDEPDAVRQCAEPPSDTSDPNWQRYGRAKSPLAGCTTADSSPSRLVPGLLLFVVLLLTRRRSTWTVS